MRNLSKKAKTIIAGAAIAGLASTGVAYAYWTTSGDGAGSAQTAIANGTLHLHADAVTDITPGSAYDVPIKADNAGSTDLRVNTVSTVVSSTKAECQTLIDAGHSGLSFVPVDTHATNVVHGVDNTVIGTGSLVFANLVDQDQGGCKDAALVLTFTGTTP